MIWYTYHITMSSFQSVKTAELGEVVAYRSLVITLRFRWCRIDIPLSVVWDWIDGI